MFVPLLIHFTVTSIMTERRERLSIHEFSVSAESARKRKLAVVRGERAFQLLHNSAHTFRARAQNDATGWPEFCFKCLPICSLNEMRH